ncbi:bifunctional oligoribonuclease/PAP phosphatase NrnA [Clostridiaceae bacterium M8S5]|nr:bifunctional oligoribonuclease/PAP phosphatase NrnA [Clostridiaceae bacterium M8S5]
MMKMFKKQVGHFTKKLNEAGKIGLISHIKPDGDNIGSLLSLGTALKELYKGKVDILKSDDIPSKYDFLSNYSSVIPPEEHSRYDVMIVLDCGDEKRIGKYEYLLDNSFVINIDHHISNTDFGDLNIVFRKASSTGEIVYKILKEMQFDINIEIATSIYVAISTDTGSFKYDNTTKETHMIAGELLGKGIDLNQITKRVYQSVKLEEALYFINTLKNIEFYYDNKLAIVTNDDELQVVTEGIVEYARDIDTVEVACHIKKIGENKVKASLRSKSFVDVAKIAQKFGGGGHIRAAGCTIESSVEVAKQNIISEMKNVLG